MTKTLSQMKAELKQEFKENINALGYGDYSDLSHVQFGTKINIISGLADIRFTLHARSERNEEYALFDLTFHNRNSEHLISYMHSTQKEFFLKAAPMVYKYCEEYVKIKGLKGFMLTTTDSMIETQLKEILFPIDLLPYFNTFNYLAIESFSKKVSLVGLFLEDSELKRLKNFFESKTVLQQFFYNEPLFICNHSDTMLDEFYFTRIYGSYYGEEIRISLEEDFKAITLDLYKLKTDNNPIRVPIELSELQQVFISLKEERQTENLLINPINHFSILMKKHFGYLTDEFIREKFEHMIPYVGTWELLEKESKIMLDLPEKLVCDIESNQNGVVKIIAFMFTTDFSNYLFVHKNGFFKNSKLNEFLFVASTDVSELEANLKSTVEDTIFYF